MWISSNHENLLENTAMERSTLTLASLFAVTLLAAGCASAPNTVTAPETKAAAPFTIATADCSQLNAEISKTIVEKRTAREKEQGAWKAVVPFAVMARYVSGKSAAESADKQLDKLYAEFNRQGCTRHGL
jgi:ABC-type transporter MlaC component